MRGEEKDNKEEGAFSKSRKTQRSPMGQKGREEERKSDREEREWKDEMREMMVILMEGMKDVKEQSRNMKEELEGWRKDVAKKEEMWRKERQELRNSITSLEKRMKEMELRALERKERKDRKRNLIIRGLEVKEEKRRKAVVGVLEKIRANGEVEEVRKLGSGEGGTETVWVRMGKEDQRSDVMKKKYKLKGSRERIMEDWTWKERKMRWRLEEIARREMAKGRKVGMGYGRLRIEEKWWK
ncbi:protein PXR1-like [Pseudomyrmex gracilis]|uniref:protein PXR1-like n=1 Tax=Pseudomyrmex gracilis TaxID=219809 RepID=UPI0009958EBB|nr:protein PXR1-like [Pseudomyrmex gracilis]